MRDVNRLALTVIGANAPKEIGKFLGNGFRCRDLTQCKAVPQPVGNMQIAIIKDIADHAFADLGAFDRLKSAVILILAQHTASRDDAVVGDNAFKEKQIANGGQGQKDAVARRAR